MEKVNRRINEWRAELVRAMPSAVEEDESQRIGLVSGLALFIANISLIGVCLMRLNRMAGLIFLPSFISVKCRCGFVLRPLGVFALFHSVFLRYFIRCSCAILVRVFASQDIRCPDWCVCETSVTPSVTNF